MSFRNGQLNAGKMGRVIVQKNLEDIIHDK